MTGDTWGISGPEFLQIFVLLAAGGLILALVWRWAAGRSADPAGVRQQGPDALAYLNGGPSLAVYTSVTGLRWAQAVTGGPTSGTLVASDARGPALGLDQQGGGLLPAGFNELDHAVHAALARPRDIGTLPAEPSVAGALRRVEERLVADGLLLSAGQRAVIRSASLIMVAVTALGAARIAAGLANHKPALYLILLTVVTLVISLRLLAAPKVSRAGRRVLAQARIGAAYLRPSLKPSWATYGVGGAMLGVALFGTAALWAADPAFAGYARIAQLSSSSGYGGMDSSSSDSSSSCSSGSSCGGGGCGGGGCGG